MIIITAVAQGLFKSEATKKQVKSSIKFQLHIIEDEEKIPLLKDEHLLLQNTYEDFDVRLMTIKDWSAIAIAPSLSNT